MLDIIVPQLNINTNLVNNDYPETFNFVPMGTQYIPISEKSPIQTRRALEKIAFFFRREFEYDFPQYSATEKTNCKSKCFLFIEESWSKYFAIGGCCLRWRNFKNDKPGWGLQWVWLHPYRRGRGIFKIYWDFFLKEYGDIYVEPPISSPMIYFLKKTNYKYLKTKPA